MSWVDQSGEQVETPRFDAPVDGVHEVRATILFWNDMRRAGASFRDIAACFSVDAKLVRYHLGRIPPEVKNAHVSGEYLGRLRAAIRECRGSQSRPGFRFLLQAVQSSDMQRCSSV